MTQYNKHQSPNIVFILTDDQGWGDLSYNGNTQMATPNIDRMANAGASFQHFYVQPLCAPTRSFAPIGKEKLS